jgi:hypothetical protein
MFCGLFFFYEVRGRIGAGKNWCGVRGTGYEVRGMGCGERGAGLNQAFSVFYKFSKFS